VALQSGGANVLGGGIANSVTYYVTELARKSAIANGSRLMVHSRDLERPLNISNVIRHWTESERDDNF